MFHNSMGIPIDELALKSRETFRIFKVHLIYRSTLDLAALQTRADKLDTEPYGQGSAVLRKVLCPKVDC